MVGSPTGLSTFFSAHESDFAEALTPPPADTDLMSGCSTVAAARRDATDSGTTERGDAAMDVNTFRASRRALHGMAELILAGPAYARDGDIRLRPTPGGFGVWARASAFSVGGVF